MRNGLQKDLGIEPQRPAVDVGEVKLHPAVEIEPAAALERPQAGQAGPHTQAPPLPRFVLLHFFRDRWAWSDERHVSAQDVPELGELIETGAAQPAPDRRHARVVGNLEYGSV